MKINRLKSTNPLPGDSRKKSKHALPCEQTGLGSKSDAVNALSDLIEILVSRKSRNADCIPNEPENGGDGAAKTRRIDPVDDVGMGNPKGFRDRFPEISLDMDLDQEHNSHEIKIARIRRNIAEGYYNSPEFIEKLADTLIKKLRLTGDGD